MDRPKLEVADIFRRYGEAYRQQHAASLSPGQRRVMILFKDNQNVKKNPRFQGNPLAGFYLTTIGRF